MSVELRWSKTQGQGSGSAPQLQDTAQMEKAAAQRHPRPGTLSFLQSGESGQRGERLRTRSCGQRWQERNRASAAQRGCQGCAASDSTQWLSKGRGEKRGPCGWLGAGVPPMLRAGTALSPGLGAGWEELSITTMPNPSDSSGDGSMQPASAYSTRVGDSPLSTAHWWKRWSNSAWSLIFYPCPTCLQFAPSKPCQDESPGNSKHWFNSSSKGQPRKYI